MTGFPDKDAIAELTAKMLIEVEAVRFMTDKPYILTSGWASPVYIDMRRVISYPRARRPITELRPAAAITREIGFESLDAIAGGETAGIPFAAWISESLVAADALCPQTAQGLRPQCPDRGAYFARQ